MKIKKGFNLRTICGEQIVISDGLENIDFSKVISLNESAAYLWQCIFGKDFNIEELTKLLTEKYEVDDETAHNDAVKIVNQWKEIGIIEE